MTGRRTAGAVAAGVAQLGLQLGHPAAAAVIPGPDTDPYPPKLAGRAVEAPNADGWYRAPVEVRWTASDGWSGLASAPPRLRVDGEGDRLAAAGTAFDRAGNHRTVRLEPALRIDRTAPVTVLEAPPGWASTDQDVGLAATDNLSGVAATWWQLDGGEPQTGDLVAVPGRGDHTVTYWSVDRAGNRERPRTTVLHADDGAPTVTHRLLPAGRSGAAGKAAPGASGWYRGPVRVAFRCEPGAAPVDRCPAPVLVRRQGTTMLSGAAVDRDGRRATDPVTVAIDGVEPTLAVRADHAPGPSGWYGEPLILTFTCDDDGSGIRAGGCPAPVQVSEGAGRRVAVQAEDVAGNRASLTVEGLDVDATPPVSELRTDVGSRAGRVVVRVRMPARDALSGVAGTWYRLDDGPTRRMPAELLLDEPGEHRLTWWTVDRAGNVEGGPDGRRATVEVPALAEPADPDGSVEPADPSVSTPNG